MEPLIGRQFLFIGSTVPEAALSKLKASGIYYRHKRLDSRPPNWQTIAEIVDDPATSGVVVKLTGGIYKLIAHQDYQDVAQQLFHSLSKKPHAVFVHENVITGVLTHDNDPPTQDDDLSDETYYDYLFTTGWSHPPDAEIRDTVNELLTEHHINLLPYRTNAELSVMASSFIDDAERNLIFRIYVPSGRLYAAEADKLLTLFRDYLNQVGHRGVRQDGYSTAAGQVYEFFGNETAPSGAITQQFDDFARFLDQCIADPSAAEAGLTSLGIDRIQAPQIVQRYGREGRRIQHDLRQERELRVLTLKHRLESELLDVNEIDDSRRHLATLVESIVPQAHDLSTQAVLAPRVQPQVNISVNQQIVHAAQGAVVHNVQGTAQFGAEAKQLIELVRLFGGADAPSLESAVHELEDPDARTTDRLGARQQIKAFLFRTAGKVEGPVLDVLQKYIEAKLGL